MCENSALRLKPRVLRMFLKFVRSRAIANYKRFSRSARAKQNGVVFQSWLSVFLCICSALLVCADRCMLHAPELEFDAFRCRLERLGAFKNSSSCVTLTAMYYNITISMFSKKFKILQMRLK